MYIYKFLNAIDELKKENLPPLDHFPTDDVFYYGYYAKEDIEPKVLKTLPEAQTYLAYAQIKDIKKLKFIPVDEQLEYIHKLESIPPSFRPGTSMARDAGIFEGIWLFSEFANLSQNPFFDADIDAGALAVKGCYSGNGIEEQPVLYLFDGVPIKRDIFFAQFHYFVKTYLQFRLCKDKPATVTRIMRDYDLKVKNEITHYFRTKPFNYNVYQYTSDKNPEFDDFIQELIILDHHMDNTFDHSNEDFVFVQ